MSAVTRIRSKEGVNVPFSPEEIWAALTDFENYPSWWPSGFTLKVNRSVTGLLGTEIEVQPRFARAFFFRIEEAEEPQSLRIRFFGGVLEGPGYLVVEPRKDGMRVACELDLFARGAFMMALSLLLPLASIHANQLRQVLRGLARHLARIRKAADQARLQAEGSQSPGALSVLTTALEGVGARAGKWLRDSPVPHLEPATEGRVVPAWTDEPKSNFDHARNYLHALSFSKDAAALKPLFHEEATEEEFPNHLLEQGASRNLPALLDARTEALARWSNQRFELRGATGGGSQVAIEIFWAGTALRDLGPVKAGERIETRQALFVKIQDHRIVRLRSYVSAVPSGAGNGPTESATSDEGPSETHLPSFSTAGQSNFENARAYLLALSGGASPSEIARFFSADAIQEELPGLFAPQATTLDRKGIQASRERSLAHFTSHDYDLRGAIGNGSKVAMEVHRTSVASAAHPSLAPGRKIETRSAMFLKFRDGLIVRQRTYECGALFGLR